jgi:hypothetical protein
MKITKRQILSTLLMTVFLLQWIHPGPVFAQDSVADTPSSPEATSTTAPETPPATEITPEATAVAPATETVTQESLTEAATEAPASQNPILPSATPTQSLSPTIKPKVEQREPTATATPDLSTPIRAESSPTLENTPTETALPEVALPAIVEQLPENTELVVLDENNQQEPLATLDALTLIAEGDPMWCPGGPITDPIGYDFTQCKKATTVSGLITQLAGESGAGTVYFMATYNDYDSTFDHNDTPGLTDLTIQGGWNGRANDAFNFIGDTTFAGQLAIINWNNNVVINNVDTVEKGTYIDTTGEIKLKDSKLGKNVTLSGANGITIDCVSYSDASSTLSSTHITIITCEGEKTEYVTTYEALAPYYFPPEDEEFRLILDCNIRSSFPVILPNGDRVEFFCPLSGEGRISRIDEAELSGLAEQNYQYISGYRVDILKDGVVQPMIATKGYIRASFVANQPRETSLAILFWDEGQRRWVKLPNFMFDANGNPRIFPLYPANPQDLRTILSGAQRIETLNPRRMQVDVNFMGRFILVQE